jgi:glutathione S-transferase
LPEKPLDSLFLPDVDDLDKFCFINTILDSAANIFYLEKFGLNIGDNMYIQRQQSRVDKSLTQLERTPEGLIPFNPSSDWHLRLACLVDWAIFRHRIEIKTYPRLATFLDAALSHNEFAQTRPTE